MKKRSLAKNIFYTSVLVILAAFFFLILKGKFPDVISFVKDRLRPKVAIARLVKYFPFSKENCLKEWEEKILRGRVVYVIEKGEEESYVRAKSQKSASALYYKTRLSINRDPLISWKWRVDKFPERKLPETIEGKKEEDFAARVYVIFPAAFFTKSKVVEYVWAETLPAGTHGRSGYSKNIQVLVLESGKAEGWRFEKRDICEDYVKLFGEKPDLNVGAIAFMTDADSTKTTACAVYDEIKVGYK